ncbi:MAG: hypothetical protein MUF42_01375 [Cytophagaceae bacterium]|jgi:cell division protein ZapB|nr:hypothetical protein [Cytophagaceae bacterium]
MEENIPSSREQKKGSNKGLLIAFIAILFLINCVQFFLYFRGEQKIEEQSLIIDANKKRIDSLTTELDKAIADLKIKQEEIAKLGGDTTRMGELIRKLEEDKRMAVASAGSWQTKYNKIKDNIDAANRLKDDAEREVERLKILLAQQDTIITNQKQTIVLREDSILKLTSVQKVLQDKVAIASELKAESFKLSAFNAKGKEDPETPFKAKRTDKIKVSFNLAENKVADKGGRDIYMRLIEPGGAALFDLANGGGSFVNADGKEIFFTMKQNILFENKGQKVSFEYKKGAPYKVGKHTIEVWCEGRMIGTGTFEIK